MEEVWKNVESGLADHQSTVFTIVIIVVIAWIAQQFGEQAIKKAVARSVKPSKFKTKSEEKKREKTVVQLLCGLLRVVIWPIALLIIIGELGVEIGPLIAGAGIVGIAVGFGAQSLVKDVIAGLFIIVENQYGVGDVVELDGTGGLVESISLRKTILRDLDGIVHHIPNGTITKTSNYSSEYSGINLNVGVSYSTDIDKVIKVVNQVGDSLAIDKDWEEYILEKPQFLRVDRFGENSIEIKITGNVKPLKQWDVTGELRKRIKVAFDKAGIEIPYNQIVVHQAKSKS